MTEPKGKPTPKRREAQRRRGGPVTTPPTNRREAAKQLRARQAEERQGARTAPRGDDRQLLARDQGPVRRMVRDLVDARRNLGGLLLPMAAVVFVSSLTKDPGIRAAFLGVWLATLLGVAFDFVLLNVHLRRALRAAFPKEEKLGGHVFYGILRSTVMRRLRAPKPQVRRGQRVS